jgi:hypothetical protein
VSPPRGHVQVGHRPKARVTCVTECASNNPSREPHDSMHHAKQEHAHQTGRYGLPGDRGYCVRVAPIVLTHRGGPFDLSYSGT